MRKIIVFISFCLFIFTMSGIGMAQDLDLEAESAILIEAETGQLLYQKNINKKVPPASITKIMTMLIAMEKVENEVLSLDDEIIISQYAESMGGSQIYLPAGVEVKLKDLLKAVAISSANDASVAIAEAISGSYSSFINLMNEKAEKLGMKNTHFMNSTGLPEANHYTTARDISIMARELIKYKKVLEWTSIWVDYVKLPEREAMLANTNKLVNKFPGMDGLKTGHTDDAGFCLAATAKRDSVRLISVILGCNSQKERQENTKRLLNYGFNFFEKKQMVNAAELIKNIKIPSGKKPVISGKPAQDLYVMLKRGSKTEPEVNIKIKEALKAPLKKGESIGQIIVTQNNRQLGLVDIITTEKIEKANIFIRLWREFVNWLGGWLQSF